MTDFNVNMEGKTIDKVWENWFDYIHNMALNTPVENSRDGAVVGEVLNAVTVISDPTRCILKSQVRKLPTRYMIGELLWYLSGNDTLDAIQLYTNAWNRMSDDNATVNSNYGHRIQYARDEYSGDLFDQMKMVEDMLRQDSSSRQAVIHIKQARDLVHYPSKDVNCTVCLQFFIRGNKLFMTTYMRSNDLWMGFPNDVFQFTCMQIYLAMRLGVELGSYTHIAGSLHLYQRDYENALKNIKDSADITIDGTPAITRKE